MKKPYVKPQVYFEDFQLSANIAGNCGNKGGAKHTDANTCYFEDAFFGQPFLTAGICDPTPQDGDFPSVCYDNPSDTTRVFAS